MVAIQWSSIAELVYVMEWFCIGLPEVLGGRLDECILESTMDWGCVSRICVEHNGRNVHCVIYEGLYCSFFVNLFVA